MNRYLIRFDKYFSGCHEFEVSAINKADALAKAKEYLYRYEYNYEDDSIRVVKKVKMKNNVHCPDIGVIHWTPEKGRKEVIDNG